MERLASLYRDERGQTATEYMVLLGSVVAVIVGAAFVFQENFTAGVTSLSTNVQTNLAAGFTGGASK